MSCKPLKTGYCKIDIAKIGIFLQCCIILMSFYVYFNTYAMKCPTS